MAEEGQEGSDPSGAEHVAPQQEAVREFADRLRELREAAGSPPYRRMASITNFSSSALAAATVGTRLPTDAVTRAFATACRADPDEWSGLLAQARQAANEPATPEFAPSDQENAESRRRLRPRLRPRPRLAAVALSATGVVVGALATAFLMPSSSAGASVRPTSGTPVFTAVVSPAPTTTAAADGEDPAAAGCAKDAVLVDKEPVQMSGVQVGALELKYSAHCGAGWARLYLYPGQPVMLGTVSVRSDDGRSASFTDPLVHQVPVYTDVIVLGAGGCLAAQGTVSETGESPVSVTISCQSPTAGNT